MLPSRGGFNGLLVISRFCPVGTGDLLVLYPVPPTSVSGARGGTSHNGSPTLLRLQPHNTQDIHIGFLFATQVLQRIVLSSQPPPLDHRTRMWLPV